MPLVAHSNLPTFDRLRQRGEEVVPLERALRQDIRELHIGLLNMMPDAALQVTEQQFMRLIGGCNQIAQFYVHPFSLEGLGRSAETQTYIDNFYTSFDQIREMGLDALIITGINVENPLLDQESFWQPLIEVIEWAQTHVTSTLCSCLSSHALWQHFHGIQRRRTARKRWGVYPFRVVATQHPLLRDINTRFDVPHSRWNDVSQEQLEAVGVNVLVAGTVAGVQMAVSPDQFKIVYWQGHPEYNHNSLLKEYKRDLLAYFSGQTANLPPRPKHYLPGEAIVIDDHFLEIALKARRENRPIPAYPEAEITQYLDNTWGDTAKAIFNNWLGLIYKMTNLDRKSQFMVGIDPDNPLGL